MFAIPDDMETTEAASVRLPQDDRETPVVGEAVAGDFRNAPREAWYCVMPKGRLRAGSASVVTILGERIVLGRKADGKAFAIRDRCPHRGAPLSRGRFDGVLFECPFHGWRFATDGRCVAMPTLADADGTDPRQVSVTTFPVSERNGLFWIYMGKRPDLSPPPPMLAASGRTRCRVVVSVSVKAGFDLAVLSLIDPAHVGFVHNAWWWSPAAAAKEKVKDFVPLDFGFRMTAHTAATNSLGYRLLGRPRTEVDFLLPGQRIERIGMGSRFVVNATFATPVDEQTTVFTNVLVSDLRRVAVLSWLVRRLAKAFLNQDQSILELAQSGLERKPTMLLLGQSDRLAQWYFRLKRDYLAAHRRGIPFRNALRSERLRWRT